MILPIAWPYCPFSSPLIFFFLGHCIILRPPRPPPASTWWFLLHFFLSLPHPPPLHSPAPKCAFSVLYSQPRCLHGHIYLHAIYYYMLSPLSRSPAQTAPQSAIFHLSVTYSHLSYWNLKLSMSTGKFTKAFPNRLLLWIFLIFMVATTIFQLPMLGTLNKLGNFYQFLIPPHLL